MYDDLLEDVDEMMPDVRSVFIRVLMADSVYSAPFECGSAELRPVDQKDRTYLASVGLEVDSTLFHLWTSTIEWPTDLEIRDIPNGSLIEEPSGKCWAIETTRSELGGLRLRCLCVEFFNRVE